MKFLMALLFTFKKNVGWMRQELNYGGKSDGQNVQVLC